MDVPASSFLFNGKNTWREFGWENLPGCSSLDPAPRAPAGGATRGRVPELSPTSIQAGRAEPRPHARQDCPGQPTPILWRWATGGWARACSPGPTSLTTCGRSPATIGASRHPPNRSSAGSGIITSVAAISSHSASVEA